MFRIDQWVRIKTLKDILEGRKGRIYINGVYISDEMIESGGAYAKILARNDMDDGSRVYKLKDVKGFIFNLPTSYFPEAMLESAFKRGTRVQIRSWDKMEEEFGTDGEGMIMCRAFFSNDMRHLCGRYATIARVYDGGMVTLTDWSSEDGGVSWRYSTDMVEPVSSLTVSVDFDGTITQAAHPGSAGFNELAPACKEAMTNLHDLGVRFYLLTSRREYLEEAVDKCKEWGLPIQTWDPNVKKMTDFYIDDKDVSCQRIDWEQIYAFLYSVLERRMGKRFIKKGVE